jgi:hypothetical protein
MTAGLQDEVVEDDAPAKDQRDAAIQRVRVGLTGLAAVFLLTLLAASIFGMLGQDDHGAKLANGVTSNGTIVPETPREPLAELGVAPGGNAPKASAPPGPVPATVPADSPAAAPVNGAAPPATRH